MKTLFTGFTIFGTIVFISLFVYFPFVYLNLVFTFDDLPPENIPYYNNASSSYDRFNSMWWIISMDIVRFSGPAVATYTVALILLSPEGFLPAISWYYVVMVVLLIMEVAKTVIFTWQYVYCSDYQLCRNFDPSGNPESANYVFYILWIYDMVYIGIWIIYLFLSDTLRREAYKYTSQTYVDRDDKVPIVQLRIQGEDSDDDYEADRAMLRDISENRSQIRSQRPHRQERSDVRVEEKVSRGERKSSSRSSKK